MGATSHPACDPENRAAEAVQVRMRASGLQGTRASPHGPFRTRSAFPSQLQSFVPCPPPSLSPVHPRTGRGLSWGPGQPLWPFRRAPRAVMQGLVQTLLCQAFGKVHTDSDVQKLCFTRLWDVLADYKITVYYSPSTTNLAQVKMDSNSLSTSLLEISSSIHIMFRSWVLIVESNGLIM